MNGFLRVSERFRRPGYARRLALLTGAAMALGTLGALGGLAVGPAPAQAQDIAPDIARDFVREQGRVVAPILLVDRERLFAESAAGRRISALLEAERKRQEERTRAIEAELKAEEQALTEERPRLSPEEFRARADAFDAKVEALRQERDQAQQELLAQIERAQSRFLQQISPVLAGILQDYGAQIMLEKRLALMSSRQVDVTDEAIARIDAALARSEKGQPTEAGGSAKEQAAPEQPGNGEPDRP